MDNKLITSIMVIIAIIIIVGSATVPAIDNLSYTTETEQIAALKNINGTIELDDNISMAVCSGTTIWAVTTDGKLYGVGNNSSGQQGDGTTTNVTTFTQRLETETIASVACSVYTTWAVTTDGKLFGCGRNYNGQQGDGTTTDVTTFTQRLATETIASVACSSTSTWAVTTDGKLYGCGKNNNGQQGDGTTTNVTTITQRLNTETVVGVACSDEQTMVLAEETRTIVVDTPYKFMLSVVPVIIIATVVVTMAAIIFRNRE